MRLTVKNFFVFVLILGTAFAISSCALLGGGEEDMGVKNSQIKYNVPDSPFVEVPVSSADKVWQSKKTGNTIAINSLCKKYESMSLENLRKNILAGFDNLKIDKTENLNFNDREAQRIHATGSAEGIPISVSLLILKKDNCTYDIAYIARTAHFEKEKALYEKFIKGFQVP